ATNAPPVRERPRRHPWPHPAASRVNRWGRRRSRRIDGAHHLCGIAGFTGADVVPALARPVLGRMIDTLAHRGPDAFGFYCDPGVGLAHARLSIIDLETGDQPMSNPAGTVWTVFNGEIFNHVELRASLEAAGHTFRTRSDTEVIVLLYERYGDRFVEHLNGQFAIALWDRTRRRLVLARD